MANDPTTFEMVREFRAPLAAVWRAFSEGEQLQRWWGPQGCSVEIERFEFRPGGICHYAMRFPGAPAMWGRFNYREIVPAQRLTWFNSFATDGGGIARAPFSALCPLEIENTVELSERDGVTTVRLRATPFGASQAERTFFLDLHPSLVQGYGGTFEQLGRFLAGT